MLVVIEIVGNLFLVYVEGWVVKLVLECVCEDVVVVLGVEGVDVIFILGVMESVVLVLVGWGFVLVVVEYVVVLVWIWFEIVVDVVGIVMVVDFVCVMLQLVNVEIGVIQDLLQGLVVSDMMQVFGKIFFVFNWLGVQVGFVSVYKLGGLCGIGVLIVKCGMEIEVQLKGGGQEQGCWVGIENLIGIMGFVVVVCVVQVDLDCGIFEKMVEFWDLLMVILEFGVEMVIFLGCEFCCLLNILLILMLGWCGEMQVMQMDLVGFVVLVGLVCLFGKVWFSLVLIVMGIVEEWVGDVICVLIGFLMDGWDVLCFVDVWLVVYVCWW